MASDIITLREHQAGDIGWIIHRHGVIYSEEYGWDSTFEALVAEIGAKFLRDHVAASLSPVPSREACWIAELNGVPVGSVMIVSAAPMQHAVYDETLEHVKRTAKLRLLFVEREARGYGIGKRLMERAIAFAKQAGYEMLTLWTQQILTSARVLYERYGFQCVREAPHHSFGHDLIEEVWERSL